MDMALAVVCGCVNWKEEREVLACEVLTREHTKLTRPVFEWHLAALEDANRPE